MALAVAVVVAVAVEVAVDVKLGVAVRLGVAVSVAVELDVGVGVGVLEAVGVAVAVGEAVTGAVAVELPEATCANAGCARRSTVFVVIAGPKSEKATRRMRTGARKIAPLPRVFGSQLNRCVLRRIGCYSTVRTLGGNSGRSFKRESSDRRPPPRPLGLPLVSSPSCTSFPRKVS